VGFDFSQAFEDVRLIVRLEAHLVCELVVLLRIIKLTLLCQKPLSLSVGLENGLKREAVVSLDFLFDVEDVDVLGNVLERLLPS
jgi:hypothetical protein